MRDLFQENSKYTTLKGIQTGWRTNVTARAVIWKLISKERILSRSLSSRSPTKHYWMLLLETLKEPSSSKQRHTLMLTFAIIGTFSQTPAEKSINDEVM